MNDVISKYNITPYMTVRVLEGRMAGKIGEVKPTPHLKGEKVVVSFDHEHKDDFVNESVILHPANLQPISGTIENNRSKKFNHDVENSSSKNSRSKGMEGGTVEIIRQKRKVQ